MARWLSPFLLGCLVKQATALAQAAAAGAEHLAVHGQGRRTAPNYGRSSMATSEVGTFGEVGFHLRKNPPDQVILSVGDEVVFGSFMLLTVNPRLFAANSAAQRAAQDGIMQVALASDPAVREVGVSLVWSEAYPQVARVDFEVGFQTSKGRQVFTKHVVRYGAKPLADNMCKKMPPLYKGQCQLSGTRQLQSDGSNLYLTLVGSDSDEAAAAVVPAGVQCYGNITITQRGPPQLLIEDPQQQEALVMAIAEAAWVSRLQVGALMAVEANALHIDFWLILRRGSCSKAVSCVTAARDSISARAADHVGAWVWDRKIRSEFPVFGRMLLDVPRPQRLAGNKSAATAVETALWQVATALCPEASQLSVKKVGVSLALAGNLSGAVHVSFGVTFNSPRDRQVFAWEFAADAGVKLVEGMNGQVASGCERRCRLPGEGSAEETAATYAELGKRFGSLVTLLPAPEHVARDPLAREAMAMAISDMASVRSEQVGFLVSFGGHLRFSIDFWVASSNETLRQAAILQMERAGRDKFLRCVLAHLDRLSARAGSRSPDLGSGSIVLHVPDAGNFSNSSAVGDALGSAVAQVVGVPRAQVQYLDVQSNQGSLGLVRVYFRVTLRTQGQKENFTRAIANDGGKKLAASINELVPEPFQGRCQLPALGRSKAPVTSATLNSTVRNSTSVSRPGDEGSQPMRAPATALMLH